MNIIAMMKSFNRGFVFVHKPFFMITNRKKYDGVLCMRVH